MTDTTTMLKEVNKKLCLEEESIRSVIFIYCSPKVGSTSLVSSIRVSASDKFKVVHIHDETMLYVLTGISGVSVLQIIQYNKSLGRNVWVFDVYRTPIERKMSEFFDKLASYHFNNTDDNLINYDIRRLITRFNNIFAFIANGDHYSEKYNLIRTETFRFEQGYELITKDDVKYVKLRLCDSEKWSDILSRLLDSKICMVKDYEMEKSKLGQLYKRFKREYKIPQNYLDMILRCPYLNYYYSSDQVNNYKTLWKNKTCDFYQGYSVHDYEVYKNICIENKWYKDIQSDHYFDEGCTCKICSKRRNYIYVQLQSNKPIEHLGKIIHDVLKKETNAKKMEKKTQIINQAKLHQQIHQAHLKNIKKNKKGVIIGDVFKTVYN